MTAVKPFAAGSVRGVLHEAGAARGGLVLAHGAGGDHNAPLLVAAAVAFAAAGIAVLRCDLPFRQRRAKGPPAPAGAAEDRVGLKRAVEALRGVAPGPIYLGGHSYGGRQASMLAAEEPALAGALLLLAYPLHPPKKPEAPRTAHLPRLRVPCVFVHGTRDAFGTIAELEAAMRLVPAETRLIPVDGAGHDLRRGRFDWAPAIGGLVARDRGATAPGGSGA